MASEQRGMREIQNDIEAGGGGMAVGVLAGALLGLVVGIFPGLAIARTARVEEDD
ncbi:MAG: hypothetical protein M3Q03_16990 [Chloroflexota bacterium]|nr:hypothetical protein [Chloroflexota bacterium]